MRNLSEEQQLEADLLLAPVHDNQDPTEGNCNSAPILPSAEAHEVVKSRKDEEWMLPCHSLLLCTHSPVFSASQRNAGMTHIEKAKDGRRIIRLPLSQVAGESFLEYCYSTLHYATRLSLGVLCELSSIGNMLQISGSSD